MALETCGLDMGFPFLLSLQLLTFTGVSSDLYAGELIVSMFRHGQTCKVVAKHARSVLGTIRDRVGRGKTSAATTESWGGRA